MRAQRNSRPGKDQNTQVTNKFLCGINQTDATQEEVISQITEAQNKREWKFLVGDIVYIHETIEVFGTGFFKYIYDGKVGDNLYFYRITSQGYKLKTSYMVKDYEFGLCKIFNYEDYQEHKQKEAIQKIMKYEKEQMKKDGETKIEDQISSAV